MQVKFYDRFLGTHLVVNDVLCLQRKKIVLHGRRKWAWVCLRAVLNQSYDCARYDLVFVLRG